MSTVSDAGAPKPRYRRVHVVSLISARYDGVCSADYDRPDSWDMRLGGIDIITTEDGETIRLLSTPMQSPPKPGWVLMLTGGAAESGFTWTLYGMPRMQ